MDPLVLRVAARHLEASDFAPPPKVFEAVRDWAFRVYAGHALARAEALLEHYQHAVKGEDLALVRFNESRAQFLKDYAAYKARYVEERAPFFNKTYEVGTEQRPYKIILVNDGESFSITEQSGKGRKELVEEFYDYQDFDVIRHIVLERFDRQRREIDDAVFEPAKDKQALVNAALLKKAASKYATKPRLIRGSSKGTVPVDITGWKYLRDGEEEAKAVALLAKKMPSITCVLFFRNHATRSGMWTLSERTLQIDTAYANVPSANTFEHALRDIAETAYHETQHLGQDALDMIRGLKNDAGMPSQKLRHPEQKDEKVKKNLDHALLDDEFYTDLRDAVFSFRDLLRHMPRTDWVSALHLFVGNPAGADPKVVRNDYKYYLHNSYFRALRDNDPKKWRKAVAEFTKLVRPYLEAGGVSV